MTASNARAVAACLGWLLVATCHAAEPASIWHGNVGLEGLHLPTFVGQAGGQAWHNPVQARDNLAVRAQLEASLQGDGPWSAATRLLLREDVRNRDRRAYRADEAWVQYGAKDWDLRVGRQLVTWGSVESVSPLDVINPRDYEEDLVEPGKIGLLQARYRLRLPGAELSAHWLPEYGDSRFPGPHSYYAIGGGRPMVAPDVRWRGDQWALRYFQSGDESDFGVSLLHALERNPRYVDDGAVLRGETGDSTRLGLEWTRVVGDLVLKLETVARDMPSASHRRAGLLATGAEYTWSALWGHSDLSAYVEWLAATRNVRETELMQNDLFAALRWTLNDDHRQRWLLGTFRDLDRQGATVWRLEHQWMPRENLEMLTRYTTTRNYYPGPLHTERNTGVLSLSIRYHF